MPANFKGSHAIDLAQRDISTIIPWESQVKQLFVHPNYLTNFVTSRKWCYSDPSLSTATVHLHYQIFLSFFPVRKYSCCSPDLRVFQGIPQSRSSKFIRQLDLLARVFMVYTYYSYRLLIDCVQFLDTAWILQDGLPAPSDCRKLCPITIFRSW